MNSDKLRAVDFALGTLTFCEEQDKSEQLVADTSFLFWVLKFLVRFDPDRQYAYWQEAVDCADYDKDMWPVFLESDYGWYECLKRWDHCDCVLCRAERYHDKGLYNPKYDWDEPEYESDYCVRGFSDHCNCDRCQEQRGAELEAFENSVRAAEAAYDEWVNSLPDFDPLPFDEIAVDMPLPVTLPAWQDEWEDIHSQQFVRSVW